MKNFILSSLIFFSSCVRTTLPSDQQNQDIKSYSKNFITPFQNGKPSFFFKTQSDIYGHYLSGLLLIKPYELNNYRIIFTTEIGIKLFDFEIFPDSFVVHYCMQKLNNKPVIKLLEKDFRLLLMNELPEKSGYIKMEENFKIISWKKEKEINYLYLNKGSDKMLKILSCSKKNKQKVLVEFNDYLNDFPKKISIQHFNIKLNILLLLIER